MQYFNFIVFSICRDEYLIVIYVYITVRNKIKA